MRHIYELVNAANTFLETHPVPWKTASNEIKATALLLLVNRDLIDKPGPLKDRHEINTRAITDETALAVLSRVQDWWPLDPALPAMPTDADRITKGMITSLKVCHYKHTQITTETAVGTYEIASKVEAAQVSQRLLELSKKYKTNTGLQRGLLQALSNWNQNQAYGDITPPQLKEKRTSLGYTQEEMARQIKVTHRQYARYEAGDAPIPDKRAIAVRNLSKQPVVKKAIKGPAKSPRRAPRPKLTTGP